MYAYVYAYGAALVQVTDQNSSMFLNHTEKEKGGFGSVSVGLLQLRVLACGDTLIPTHSHYLAVWLQAISRSQGKHQPR